MLTRQSRNGKRIVTTQLSILKTEDVERRRILDGGASTALWLNGKLANNPAGSGERAVSDIIYFK